MRVLHLEVVPDDEAQDTLASFETDSSFGMTIARGMGHTLIAQVEKMPAKGIEEEEVDSVPPPAVKATKAKKK